MIDQGANPHIRDEAGRTQIDLSNLVNVPSVKSVFFPIKKFPSGNLGDPWFYTTGVYDGKYGRVIGKGGEGMVIQGEWNGQAAAYKFVEMKGQKYHDTRDDHVADMNERLKEMTEMMATLGDAILHLEAHFR